MLTQIKLTNFKCFKEETTFPLSKFNLFTGVNGGGKSTLLQSLLLMKQSIEHDIYTSELLLNGSCINLGSFDDVRNREISATQPIFFEFCKNGIVSHDSIMSFHSQTKTKTKTKNTIDDLELHFDGTISYELKNNDDMGLSISNMKFKNVDDKRKGHKFSFGNRWLKEEWLDYKNNPITQVSKFHKLELMNYYLEDCELNGSVFDFDKIHFISADRIGPQEIYSKSTLSKFPNVGTRGEFTVNLLNKLAEESVNETLCLGDDATTLITQTQEWLGKILNPMKLEVPRSKTNVLELFFNDAKPANVGFGYSSILPIIVSGLIAKPNEKIIVENPEIHLHPKAQSALIEFLVRVANTGVQVFVESHSDHVLNALRIAVLKEKLTPEDANILYFQNNTQKIVQKIPIQKDGRIEDWPENFFDQMDNDFNVLFGV